MYELVLAASRIVLITFRNPSTLPDVRGLTASIKNAMSKAAPAKAILAADFRIETAFTPDVLDALTHMMTRDNAMMECSAVLIGRNAVGLQIYNASRSVSTFEKRMVSSSPSELLHWLKGRASEEELATIGEHFGSEHFASKS